MTEFIDVSEALGYGLDEYAHLMDDDPDAVRSRLKSLAREVPRA